MRAEIDASGTLIITAETRLEVFALRTWWTDFTDPSDHPKKYTMRARYDLTDLEKEAKDNT
jgi:hypothetical protein